MSNFNISVNNYGNYSIEECIENMLKRIAILEEENKQLKANFVGETISDEVIQLLNKKLKNDVMLLCSKIDQICGENVKLTQDQKSFNNKTRDDIFSLIIAYDKIKLKVETLETEVKFIQKISHVAYDNIMKLKQIVNTSDNDSENTSDNDKINDQINNLTK
jgi:hypothetical protein